MLGKWKHIPYFKAVKHKKNLKNPRLLFLECGWNFALFRLSLGKIFNRREKKESEMHLVVKCSSLSYSQSLGSPGQMDLLHQFIGTHPRISPIVNILWKAKNIVPHHFGLGAIKAPILHIASRFPIASTPLGNQCLVCGLLCSSLGLWIISWAKF